MGTVGRLRREVNTVCILRSGGWEGWLLLSGWLGVGGGWCAVLVYEIIFVSCCIDRVSCTIIVGSPRVEWLDVSMVGRRHV